MIRTRIVATLGPASAGEEQIAALIAAGVDAFRLNFSHGTHAEHGRTIQRIRRARGTHPIAILQDLCGPKLRLDRPVCGEPGEEVELALPDTVQPGDPVLLADGAMHLEVIRQDLCRVMTAGEVPAGKGINLPSTRLDLPSLTDKDRADLEFGVQAGVDLVALSFVRRASDLDEVRRSGVPVIAKIEKAEAVQHLAEIVEAADGIMVARGDLGVEIPIERVPFVQKDLIALANRKARPVITATQMMRSMVESRTPTRAEVTDVANAVLDGTDAVMLSEETAVGRHPAWVVEVMNRILGEAQAFRPPGGVDPGADAAAVMAHSACEAARRLSARALVVATRSGHSACQVARFRPPVPIIALTPDETVRRRLNVVWGVIAVVADWIGDTETVLRRFREPVRATGLAQPGDPVVLVAGWPLPEPGITNLVHAAVV